MQISSFAIFFIPCTFIVQSTFGSSQYQNVIDRIFKGYNPSLRPVFNHSSTTEVKIHYGVMSLLQVEEVTKSFQCLMYLELFWEDEFLKWDEQEFDNISSIRYPAKSVWLPDIILINNPVINTGPPGSQSATNVVLNSDGTVFNVFITVYKVSCDSLDLSQFPFDTHECFMDFMSWTYSGEELDLIDDMDSYKIPDSLTLTSNHQWHVEVKRAIKRVEIECCPNGTYPRLSIPIVFTRKPLYYIMNIVLPITITCSVSFVGMFSRSTNTGERTEKAFLGITTLLAVSLLMFSVSEKMPVTSNSVTLMGLYLGLYIVGISVAIICTSFIMLIDFHGKKGQPLPRWVKYIFIEILAKVVLIPNDQESELDQQNSYEQKEKAKTCKSTHSPNRLFHVVQKPENEACIHALCQVVTAVENLVTLLVNEKKEKEKHHQIRKEWSTLCIVLDRICLIIFLTLSILLNVFLFT